MIDFPNAKINLGLNIVEKRTDGFHNIESCFYPVLWQDVLEIIDSPILKFSASGIAIPGKEEDNLCLRAWKLLNQAYNIAPVHIHLHKIIPIGAGLGGGSADAAFTLKMLNKKFDLELSDATLVQFAQSLGSDCAFFIANTPTMAVGKGDEFKSIDLSLAGNWVLLIYPDLHISTQTAYSGVKPALPETAIAELLQKDKNLWKEQLKNDFEKNLFTANPVLQSLKQQLYEMGAFYASMTGSGSCIFGLFEEEPEIAVSQYADYKIFKTKLAY